MLGIEREKDFFLVLAFLVGRLIGKSKSGLSQGIINNYSLIFKALQRWETVFL
jgi:hypothetical protein